MEFKHLVPVPELTINKIYRQKKKERERKESTTVSLKISPFVKITGFS